MRGIFLSLIFRPCSRTLLTCLTCSRKICPTRLAKRPNGISRRHILFYTKSARLCCGATQTTPPVNPQRYVPVHTCMYSFVLVCTCLYLHVLKLNEVPVCTSMYQYVLVCTCLYLYVQILNDDWPLQHAHIENIKSVANLSNNKDVFTCIL